MSTTRHGCLVIADISGYTRYLSGVELEHSTDVLADLLQTVVDALAPTFRIAKIEGDAVFAYDGGERDGAVVVDAVTGTYLAFMRRRRTVATLTTCSCAACRSIADLGLKVVAHRGEYATHTVAAGNELVGRDVVVAHRLLKNDVLERTGARDYALYTESLVSELALVPTVLGWRREPQTFDDVGTVDVYVDDLGARWDGEVGTPRHVVPEGRCAAVVWELPAPPPVVWEYLSHPEQQIRFMADRSAQERPSGARGPGMTAHCVHGSRSFDIEVLDWIPYQVQTVTFRTRGLSFLYSTVFEAIAPGRTRLVARIAPLAPRRASILFPLVRRVLEREYRGWMQALEELLRCETGGTGVAHTG